MNTVGMTIPELPSVYRVLLVVITGIQKSLNLKPEECNTCPPWHREGAPPDITTLFNQLFSAISAAEWVPQPRDCNFEDNILELLYISRNVLDIPTLFDSWFKEVNKRKRIDTLVINTMSTGTPFEKRAVKLLEVFLNIKVTLEVL
jgi:hypothetical protein